jgi:RNA polymerase sigma-70 factor (ECF subfamily)
MSEQSLTTEFLARLRAFIRRRVLSDSDADDVLQDVLLKLVEKGRQVGDQCVPAWLFTVARRAVIDRSRTPPPIRGACAEIESVPEEEDPTVIGQLAECMEPMLRALDEGDRAILRRVDMEGKSQAEIGRELGVAISTVKSRVQRARARLLRRLLACCKVEHDVRGALVEYEPLPDGICGPGGCGCQPSLVRLQPSGCR